MGTEQPRLLESSPWLSSQDLAFLGHKRTKLTTMLVDTWREMGDTGDILSLGREGFSWCDDLC